MERDFANLPRWCKEAKKAMIEKGYNVPKLAGLVGLSPTYTSSVLNGRVFSQNAVNLISDVLEIKNIPKDRFYE